MCYIMAETKKTKIAKQTTLEKNKNKDRMSKYKTKKSLKKRKATLREKRGDADKSKASPTPVTRTVRKEIRLDDFTKGLLEKLVKADAKQGRSSTESSIIREAIHKYYVEKKNEPI